MYQAVAAALGLTALIARVSLGYGSIDCCAPPPCGCEVIVCCDPCADIVAEPAPPKTPGTLPAPAKRQTPPPAPVAGAATPRTTNAFPSPPNVNAPTPAETPQPTLEPEEPAEPATADIEPSTPQPPAESPQPPAAAEEPPRYSTPPAEEPAATPPAADPYAELFPDDAGTPPAETPATEDAAPAESTPPATTEEPPATDEQPATEDAPATPDYDELFPPSSAIDILSAPGGLASDAPRPWTDVNGHLLLTARVTKVTPARIVVTCEDGMSHAFAYSELSQHDLGFVRRQVDARRVQLAEQAKEKELLATQGR